MFSSSASRFLVGVCRCALSGAKLLSLLSLSTNTTPFSESNPAWQGHCMAAAACPHGDTTLIHFLTEMEPTGAAYAWTECTARHNGKPQPDGPRRPLKPKGLGERSDYCFRGSLFVCWMAVHLQSDRPSAASQSSGQKSVHSALLATQVTFHEMTTAMQVSAEGCYRVFPVPPTVLCGVCGRVEGIHRNGRTGLNHKSMKHMLCDGPSWGRRELVAIIVRTGTARTSGFFIHGFPSPPRQNCW